VPSAIEHPNRARRPAATRGAWWLPILAAGLFLAHSALAQEALRSSMAGEQAEELQKQAAANPYYNLQMGDLKLRFVSSLQVEGNDNVNLANSSPQADMSIRSEVDMTALWPVTENNTLALTIGAGYEKYLRTKSLDSFFFTPDSAVSFNIYAGDFLINLHTHFVYSAEQYQNVDVSGASSYTYFEDLTGLSVLWDLNKLKITFTYDHDIYLSDTPGFSYSDRNSELFSLRAGVETAPGSIVGLELGGSIDNYGTQPEYNPHGSNSVPVYATDGTYTDPTAFASETISQKQAIGTFLGNQQSVNFGPYIQAAFSPHLSVEGSAGYTIYFLSQSSFEDYPGEAVSVLSNIVTGVMTTNRAPANPNTLSAFYADVTLTHMVNAKVKYTLTAGHQIQEGIYSDTLELYYANLNPTFMFIRNITLQTPINYNYAERGGTDGETYSYWEAGLVASYQMNAKVVLTSSYYYRAKQSDVPANDFVQNQLVLGLHYSF
jgi:hypothetical protein